MTSVDKRSSNGSQHSAEKGEQPPHRGGGISWTVTAFFLIAQMAGAGFLSLPGALRDTGWTGLLMMLVFCGLVGYSGTRLGVCWVILEERWPERYLKEARQPYMEIAERSYGMIGRRLAVVCVVVTLIGATTVQLVLLATFLQPLAPALSQCWYTMIFGAALVPFTWLGTPKDFWQASVMAVVATVVAIVVVIVELLLNNTMSSDVQYPNPTVATFSLGFGAILFAFGGASVFPTIQNDMADRTLFWKSITVGFAGILSLYLPVMIVAYTVLGSSVSGNILQDVPQNTVVTVAIGFEMINLFGTYLITFNPVAQAFEEMCNVPPAFGIKRVLVRSGVVLLEIFIGLAIPDFGDILTLAGGSTITLCSFILPPLMYMRLVDNCENPKWPKRTIPLWERVLLWEIIVIGTAGGLCTTVTALIGIISKGLDGSCLVNWDLQA